MATAEWTADEQLINEALLAAARASERNAPVRHLSGTDSYLNHVREALLPVLERVRAGVKAACPSIPPAPEGDFRAEWGPTNDRRTLELSPMADGGLSVEAEDRDERVTLYLEAEDVARLRVWLG